MPIGYRLQIFKIMRKLFLSLVFLLALGVTFMSANSVEKEASIANFETFQLAEDFSCVTDCNWAARNLAILVSEDQEDRSITGELMQNYNLYFNICMNGCDD